MIRLRYGENRGFTLIEIILALVIVAMMGAMLVVFMGTNIVQSGNPVAMVKDQSEVNQVMENIVQEYKARIKNANLKIGGTGGLLDWINATYGAYVDGSNTKFITFDGSNAEIDCPYPAVGCYSLKLALKKNDMSVTGIFTE